MDAVLDGSPPLPGRRWRPSRAGILNVYQYEDETLHFAGGRLLLRGVNGSGKSTAMNMLLPFLLEADTRRIDAAGEQTGVLKSWMLADNEETQRTGYLWIEFARPDEAAPGGTRYHTVGCGIRANRSTDRVSSWWFSTPRRARIDFRLTANRVPLAVDALRAELGPGAVFGTPTEYRAEIARTFFGGADPSAYLALLHQVRNPRVGDRIDSDLPNRLREALPPVAEDAVADAAQPLEDLEEHRRNVLGLTRTDQALSSVLGTYRDYARRVLRAAAERAGEAVSAARSAAQRRGRLRTAADEADAEEKRLAGAITGLERDRSATEAELSGIESSKEYRQWRELLQRREHVAALTGHANTLGRAHAEAERRVRGAAELVRGRCGRVEDDLRRLGTELVDVARHARAAATSLPLPSAPELRAQRLDDGVEGPEGADPLAGFDLRPAEDAVRLRRRQLAEVIGRLAEADRAADAARDALADAETAEERADEERRRAAAARAEAERAAGEHRSAVLAWADRLAAHAAGVPAAEPGGPTGWLPAPARPDPGGDDPRALARARVRAAAESVAALEARLDPALAAAELGLRRAQDEAARVAAELASVRDAVELPLPRPPWQSGDPPDERLFASLVDFHPDLEPGRRAGLEAACEASGLLTASVGADGSVVTAEGELLLHGDVDAGDAAAVTPHLGAALVPAVSDDPTGRLAGLVAGVLTRVGLGAAGAAPLWVADDGRFGAGPLRGRHRKPVPEHIGAGAREAARQRRLAELEAELAAADALRNAAAGLRDGLVEHRDGLRRLAAEVPPTREVDDTAATLAGAVRDAQQAGARAAELRGVAVAREAAAERLWAQAQTSAAEAGLPPEAAACERIGAALEEVTAVLRVLPAHRDAARRSLGDWAAAVDDWRQAAARRDEAADESESAAEAAETARVELAAAEAAAGTEPERLAAMVERLTARRAGLATELKATRASHDTAVREAATAAAEAEVAEATAEQAERACLQVRAEVLAVTEVPGLLDAGREVGQDDAGREDGPDPEDGGDRADPVPLASLPTSVDGIARLVAALRALVPSPSREVTEDSLDRSLRGIRDSLGAGWDAETRRAGDGAPVAVEVSGPYGRRALLEATRQVAADLRRARGLLTAQQDQALRNLLHGRVAREVATTMFEAAELVRRMNQTLEAVTSSHGIGVRLHWRTRSDLDPATATALRLLAKDPEARTADEDASVRAAVAGLVDDARAAEPEASYRDVIGRVLDYRSWHELKLYLRRPGRADELLTRRTRLSEGEKKLVTYLPMAAAAAASAAAHDPHSVGAPRLILLDDAFAKVSEDNHARLFGLLVELDLDFVITSERLFGTHASVPELAITEVLRDADLRTIALVHYHWDGRRRTELAAAGAHPEGRAP